MLEIKSTHTFNIILVKSREKTILIGFESVALMSADWQLAAIKVTLKKLIFLKYTLKIKQVLLMVIGIN